MTTFTLEGRLIMAHIVNHIAGSNAHKQHGAQSMGTKLVKSGGLETDTQAECVSAVKRILQASITAKLPCSGVYFAELGKKQPKTVKAQAEALAEALEDGQDVWLSRRGGLTVGINSTGQKAEAKNAKPKVELTDEQDAALAAFLKD